MKVCRESLEEMLLNSALVDVDWSCWFGRLSVYVEVDACLCHGGDWCVSFEGLRALSVRRLCDDARREGWVYEERRFDLVEHGGRVCAAWKDSYSEAITRVECASVSIGRAADDLFDLVNPERWRLDYSGQSRPCAEEVDRMMGRG